MPMLRAEVALLNVFKSLKLSTATHSKTSKVNKPLLSPLRQSFYFYFLTPQIENKRRDEP